MESNDRVRESRLPRSITLSLCLEEDPSSIELVKVQFICELESPLLEFFIDRVFVA
jgi:hypothetical protein